MNAHDKNALDSTLKDLAEVMAQMQVPKDVRIIATAEQHFGGDREVKIVAEQLPQEISTVKRYDPNPIEGHKLGSLPFMRNKRAA